MNPKQKANEPGSDSAARNRAALKGLSYTSLVLIGIMFVLPSPVFSSEGVLNITDDTILSENHVGSIVISSDDVTLDCNGYSITGGGLVGVDIDGRSRVVVRNCTVVGSSIGIRLRNTVFSTVESNLLLQNTNGVDVLFSTGNVLVRNNARNNGIGFYVFESNGNRLTSNDSNLDGIGYYLDSSNNNIVNRNAAEADTNGYKIVGSSGNLLADNVGENNNTHFVIQFSSNNTFGENRANLGYDGFSLHGSHNNIMNENTASNNILAGYRLLVSNGNKIAGNTAEANGFGFSVEAGSQGNEIILNWIRSNGVGIHVCKPLFRSNDLFPNEFSGKQRRFALDNDC